ncbi:M20 family metallopeptidase [Rhodoplanes azumiensis]|uniref:M20 family metallopeptidase n=1 Tax=Rhodoplanes azumiensis TaxID=1897628 RepID=A0ABW5AMI1_9BRAD
MTDLPTIVDAEIDAARETLVDLCAALVAAPSMSPPGHTAGVAPIVERVLDAGGVASERAFCDPDAPNIVAHVDGAGTGPQVVFNAHMDTMQAGDETRWTVPILTQTRRDGRLYGLGMGNMKGALAAMCLATTVLARHRDRFRGRLTMTAVCDEVMFGERGAVHLLAARPDVHGDYLISGEGPGWMELAVAEKGLLWLDVVVRGDGGHSSRALTGRTAVAKLAALLSRIDPINSLYATVPPEIGAVTGGPDNAGLRVSLSAGTVAAGGVRSLIATTARAEIDVRLPPGVTAHEIEARVREAAEGDPDVTVTAVKAWDANWTALDDPLTLAAVAAATAVRGRAPRFVVRLPGSDARRWRALGVPAICYGPQPTLSAGVDDFAFEQDVVDCAKVYARTALALLARQRAPAAV